MPRKGSQRTRLRLRPLMDFGTDRHASWLELFFDLVFVLVVAQVAHELLSDHSAEGALRFGFLFIPFWWAWVGYTFYADRFEEERDILYRLLMLAGMLAVAALAVNVHNAFGGGSEAFALSYIAVRGILVVLYMRAWRHIHLARELSGFYIKGFILGIGLWGASLLVPEPIRFWFWGAGLLVELLTPLVSSRLMRRTPYDTSHIPERFGLFTIIVLGEMLLSAMAGLQGTEWRLELGLAAAGGFAICAALWWIYFDFIETCAVQRWQVAGQLYVYGHLPVVIALTMVGVGLHEIIPATSAGLLGDSSRWLLCGGVALYLFSIAGIRMASGHMVLLPVRIGVAMFILLLAIAGAPLPPLPLVASLLGALVVQVWGEARNLHEAQEEAEKRLEAEPEERLVSFHIASVPCRHTDQIQPVTPTAAGCQECIALGELWVEARLCMTCGHVGCCDTSKHKHASKHFHETGHPIIETVEPGPKWRWCYVDETYL